MIFVILGSQKFQFNRLLKEVDRLIEYGIIKDEVFCQIGYSSYTPQRFKYERFLNHDAFDLKIAESSLVISHGGTGAIIHALKLGKKVIAVPRLARYGEHVDDHQTQVIGELGKMDFICACQDIEKLAACIEYTYNRQFKKYCSNPQDIIDSIDEYITASASL